MKMTERPAPPSAWAFLFGTERFADRSACGRHAINRFGGDPRMRISAGWRRCVNKPERQTPRHRLDRTNAHVQSHSGSDKWHCRPRDGNHAAPLRGGRAASISARTKRTVLCVYRSGCGSTPRFSQLSTVRLLIPKRSMTCFRVMCRSS
jgi:hypothetical protein